MSVTKPHILNVEVFMNDLEFSDIEIFQNSGKGIQLFMIGHKNWKGNTAVYDRS